jgi:hypothetical protein
MNTEPSFVYSRRSALKTLWSGFGYLAFAGLATRLAANEAAAKAAPLTPKPPHFTPRAKRVIFLCMNGGPSHVDTFDYKPSLQQSDGKSVANRNRGGYAKLLASPWKFTQHGQGGLWISELFPEVAKHADDLCLVRSMQTDLPAHPQAFLQMHTGSFQFTRPSLGAWTLYGLGTENENLPGFITLNPPLNNGGAQNYGSAFLPAIYQGTRIGAEGPRIGAARAGFNQPSRLPNVTNTKLSREGQRAQLDFIQSLNRERLEMDRINPQVEGVIESYELAFRMQSAVPDVMDIAKETDATRKLYGLEEDDTAAFGRQCLLARRFLEAGVRFVEIGSGGWDQHRNLKADHERNAASVDKPIAGLLADLKQRGLLKDTLVIWGGEFGRTPYAQGDDGRDHNNKGFTLWMAGGGVKGGLSYGSTDDYGAEAVENKVHIHDLHATILHLLGLDHEKLTYRYAGRDFRLTDVKGHVAKGILA